MPWQPDGRYYGFEKEAIHAFAPAVSGVYGLYNFDYQLFIGEADNIREALLRHLDRDHSGSPRFQPTGFTFKTCPAELRERNAEALIQQYQPVRQNELALSDKLALPLDDRAIEAFFRAWADKNELNSQELNSLNEQFAPKVRRRFYFERSWGVAFAAAFVVSMGVNFYLGILTGVNIQKRAVAVTEKPLARIPLVAPLAKQPALDPAPPSNSAITPASECGQWQGRAGGDETRSSGGVAGIESNIATGPNWHRERECRAWKRCYDNVEERGCRASVARRRQRQAMVSAGRRVSRERCRNDDGAAAECKGQ